MITRKPTVVLVDGTNLFYRAFFAGKNTKQLKPGYLEAHMFLNSILSNIRNFMPCSLLVCWDRGASEYRKKILPSYKEHRKRDPADVKRMAMLRMVMNEITPRLGLYEIGVQNVEADDLIAHFYHRFITSHTVVIVSGDSDLNQFHSAILCNLSSSAKVVTRKAARRNLVSKIIMGDKSDGISGIPRYGPVTTDKLLAEVGTTFECVLGHFAGDRPVAELLLRNRRLIDLSYARKLIVHHEVRRDICSQLLDCYRRKFDSLAAVSTLRRAGLVKASDPGIVKQFKEIKDESDRMCRCALQRRDRSREVDPIPV